MPTNFQKEVDKVVEEWYSECMTKTALLPRLPNCDFCRTITLARYDFRTTDGRWAYGCEAHYRIHRASKDLGTGNGQRLELAR